jgi:hypothetical protein
VDDVDGPYRSPGASRLGPVVRRFALRRRRRGYAGAAAMAAPRPFLLGGLAQPPLPRAGASWSRAVLVRDAVELCAHGLRVRSPSGLVELTWDQLVAVEREELAGELHQVRVIGVHGEALVFDRTVVELPALAAALTEAVARASSPP